MAIVLDATIGGANANAYLTEERSIVLAETLPYATSWLTDTAIVPNRPMFLIHGTRLMDRHLRYDGERATVTQALSWPRVGLVDEQSRQNISQTIIPEFVELATLEWAFALAEDADQDQDLTSFLSGLQTGTLRLQFRDRSTAPVIPVRVTEIIGPYLDTTINRSQTRLVRG